MHRVGHGMAGLEEMKLPLLQPSVAAMIGYMRPPASLLLLLISSNRPHSPVTSLVFQEATEYQLESVSVRPNEAQASLSMAARALRRSKGE
jgi:hypothetical protein